MKYVEAIMMNGEYKDPQEGQEPEGRYANYFEIGYNVFEFLLNFGQLYSGDEMARLHTRIITNPTYAKTFLKLLCDSIEQYEQRFRVITDENGSGNKDVR